MENEDGELIAALAARATATVLAEMKARHVAMYEKRLAWGKSPVNVSETEWLLGLWKTMPATYEEASEEQKNEIIDALSME